MRNIEAAIDLRGIESSDTSERICIMFPDPSIYLHGTRGQMIEFARQITEKAGG
jgi:hypothetical protein